MTTGIVYYSDGRGDTAMLAGVRSQLLRATAGGSGRGVSLPLVSVTLGAVTWPEEERARRIMPVVFDRARGYLTMFTQILAGLEALNTEVVFLCEHDVLYHPSHFDFRPPRPDTYYYNLHVWKVDWTTGRAVTYETKQTSGLCANRALLVRHYRERVRRVEAEGFTRAMGFEPGSHGRKERVDDVSSASWLSALPNIDIRHGHNLTESRWSQDKFRTPPVGWREATEIPGWGATTTHHEWLSKY